MAAMGFALGASIFATVIGSFPKPQLLFLNMPLGASMGVVLGLIYRGLGAEFDLSPDVMIALAAVFIGLGSYLRANPKTQAFGLDINMVFLISAEVGLTLHTYPELLMGGVALIGAALMCTFIFRAMLIYVQRVHKREK